MRKIVSLLALGALLSFFAVGCATQQQLDELRQELNQVKQKCELSEKKAKKSFELMQKK